jgi:hypothetical protein
MNAPSRPLASERLLLQLRIIALTTVASGLVIAGIGAAMTLGDELAAGGSAATALFGLWVGTAIATIAGWWILSRRALSETTGPGAHTAIAAGRVASERLASHLIAAYALLEGQLLVAFVASIVQGTPMLLVPAFAILALGVLLSFPRREWLAPFERGRSPHR